MTKKLKNKAKGFGISQNVKRKAGQENQLPKIKEKLPHQPLCDEQLLLIDTDEEELFYQEEIEEQNKWVQEQLSRNLSIKEFNEEFMIEGWSLQTGDGNYSKMNDGNVEKYSGNCLFLKNVHKSYIIEIADYDENNPIISRHIFEAMADW